MKFHITLSQLTPIVFIFFLFQNSDCLLTILKAAVTCSKRLTSILQVVRVWATGVDCGLRVVALVVGRFDFDCLPPATASTSFRGVRQSPTIGMGGSTGSTSVSQPDQCNGHPTMYPKSEWHQRVYDPGAFKLNHLQSRKPIFAKWISTLLTGHMHDFPFPAYLAPA